MHYKDLVIVGAVALLVGVVVVAPPAKRAEAQSRQNTMPLQRHVMSTPNCSVYHQRVVVQGVGTHIFVAESRGNNGSCSISTQ